MAAATAPNEIVIVSAIWGVKARTTDVTTKVITLIQPQAAPFVVNAGSLGADPAPGTKKTLVITYKYHGATSTISVPASQSMGYQQLVQNAGGGTAAAGAAPEPPSLTEEQLAGVVLIEGDKGVATGFLAKVRGVLCVVTNLHVLGDNEKVIVKDMEGRVVAVQSIAGAVGADIALLRVANPSKVANPLDTADDVLKTAKIGDKVMVVGNRLGGGVATQTSGQIKGIGPARVELDANFQHGNSGSPIFDLTTKQVVGVAAYTETNLVETQVVRRRKTSTDLVPETRWFGFRIDTVKEWQEIDWTTWRAQSQRVNDFRDDSIAMRALLEGQFTAAKAADPHLRSLLAPYDALLTRIEKSGDPAHPPAAKADRDQLGEMLHSVGAYANEGTKEFVSAEFYDFFRNGEYWETSVPQQTRFREELIKGLNELEIEIQAAPAPNPVKAPVAQTAEDLNVQGCEKFDQRDFDGAIADFTRASEIDPNFTNAYYNRGNAKREKGDLDGAIADYNRALELEPKYILVLDSRGSVKATKGDLDGAIADYDRSIVLDSKFAKGFADRGVAKYKKGDREGALADDNRAIKLDPTLTFAFSNRGVIRFEKGDPDGAIADYDRAIALDPKYVTAFNNRGNAKSAKGDPNGAMADFTAAIALDPKYTTAYVNRGDTRRAQQNYTEAIKDYDQAVRLDPTSANAYNGRGLAEYAKGDYVGAIADYSKVVALNPKYAPALANRGNAEVGEKNLDGAIADYNRALTLDPKFAGAFIGRAFAKNFKGDLDGAITDYGLAIESDPKNADAFDGRGSIRKAKGDLDGAVADFSQAITLSPKAANGYGHRGDVRSMKGDLKGAIADYSQVIKIDPTIKGVYLPRGLAKLDQDDLPGALADFREAASRGDEYGAFWLFLSQVQTNRRDDAAKELAATLDRMRKPGAEKWPLQVGSFLLGKTTFSALLAQATAEKDEEDRSGETCEAWFYQGMLQRDAGQRAEAMDSFRKCIATGRKSFTEYQEALREIKALEAGAK